MLHQAGQEPSAERIWRQDPEGGNDRCIQEALPEDAFSYAVGRRIEHRSHKGLQVLAGKLRYGAGERCGWKLPSADGGLRDEVRVFVVICVLVCLCVE